MHIMVANPTAPVPNVYDFWFQQDELRYFKTEKDCQDKGVEILKWARQNMEKKKLTVLDTWFECIIGVNKGEKASYHTKFRGYQEL